ncbi:MAG: universal stress protein [Verrucomicrobia bacterium]|nr:universal stress protein [Verrucomicrobiota bacterium]
MSPIICTTDFSEHTVEAAKAAAALAHCMNGNLVLVRSVDERHQFPHRLRPRLMNEDRPRLAKEAERLRQLGLVFEEKLLRGVPDDGVVKLAMKSGARLVVVGCSPTTATERWVLGCTAEAIAESSPVPTLAVRSAAPFEEWVRRNRPLRIFVGMDLTGNSDAALRWLGEFCRLGSCDLLAGLVAGRQEKAGWLGLHELLRAVDQRPCPPDVLERDLKERVARVLGGEQVRVCVAAGTGRVDADLAELARKTETDLLVVGTHQRTGFTRLQHRSVFRGVLRRAPMNVLCVPDAGVERTMDSCVRECRLVPPMPPESNPRPLLNRGIRRYGNAHLPDGWNAPTS